MVTAKAIEERPTIIKRVVDPQYLLTEIRDVARRKEKRASQRIRRRRQSVVDKVEILLGHGINRDSRRQRLAGRKDLQTSRRRSGRNICPDANVHRKYAASHIQ